MANLTQTNSIKALSTDRTEAHFSDWWELTKPRLSLMSVATAVLGYFAAGPALDLSLFFSLCLGTTLAAFGCGVLNQWWERDVDAKMERTADRAIAAGRISPTAGFIYGIALALTGVVLLAYKVNITAALLTAATVVLYILAYTPLKRVTPWATEIGAIPGALPPLIGWVAAGAGFSSMGWILFAILFAWQLPHFMAISWMCRRDYEEGGFKMLSVSDATGRQVAIKALAWTIVLCLISLAPLREPQFGWLLLVVSLVLGYAHLKPAIQFVRDPGNVAHARKLFIATLLYLPAYLGALVVDRFFI
ncbi:protoheme IX farnesyltransferase [Puniceicoccales bacterium CK1056]|uniref:Protoheme IX farnesyltransferase n=1 Tax=Oceanipulchritudo coccoides TaxID=2706888 RepID=A0A6B2M5D6_9BACT|nr:heme o synthase [Oceanipulchritudo coccoides]NDV63337.1 protoheme IX farnesyltransferase [Oceanipulchritudo coccoides]